VFARCGGYRVELVTSSDDALVSSSSGLAVSGARSYRSLRGAVDTLLVPGGDGAEELRCDARFLDWLARKAATVRRLGSICTGAFPLAAAGILDGRRATTHWGWCDRLARAYPAVRVEADPIFVQDGSVYTSAGVTSGIDLALAMVEDDHGRLKAKTIARELVMYLRRPGGQSQFSEFLPSGAEQRTSIEALQIWIANNIRRDLSVEALAGRCAMSPRHFARVFAAETGVTPARFVERMRVTVARELIEDSGLGLKQIAERCGFGGIDSMRRSFVRTLGVTPSRYLQPAGPRPVRQPAP
jgi:transcriptional regulator GlxA family with amidase domain